MSSQSMFIRESKLHASLERVEGFWLLFLACVVVNLHAYCSRKACHSHTEGNRNSECPPPLVKTVIYKRTATFLLLLILKSRIEASHNKISKSEFYSVAKRSRQKACKQTDWGWGVPVIH